MGKSNKYPEITWDFGTAYDFFVSLLILHRPTDFGLRSAWAAGMRQRLPTRDRDVLESFQDSLVIAPPLKWLYSLPEPKDGSALLQTAKELPPLERLYALIGLDEADQMIKALVENISTRGAWSKDDRDTLVSIYNELGKKKSPTELSKKMDTWTQGGEFGEKILKAFQTYYEVFFAEEERRILPALNASLAQAQEYAQHHDLPDLFEEISQGIRYSDERFKDVNKVILVPSFWASPFLFYSSSKPIFLFGARPDNASLVPGELVPDALIASLNALSDPTRLKILRYLSTESLTPTQLATRLRLRAPTVLHHIKALRAAGLVYVMPGPKKKEVHYQTRTEQLNQACEMLKRFVSGGDEE
jgi:DNA-binding transcriptional ArsR family regulator